MSGNNLSTLEHDDGVRVEDMFRRASFKWAVATKELVRSSTALGKKAKVPYAALVDIQYARDLLEELFMPMATTVPAAHADQPNLLTAAEVHGSVSDLVARVVVVPPDRPQLHLVSSSNEEEPSPPSSSPPKRKKLPLHRGQNLANPVCSKNGKMLWADFDCPVCPSPANKRCQTSGGVYIEKPHPQRRLLSETLASMRSNLEADGKVSA